MTGLLRRLARVSLSAMFVSSGVDVYRNPGGRAERAARAIPGLPEPQRTARILGLTMASAGTALALDVLPGLSAAVLALCLVPVTYVGHPFWSEEDEAARRNQRIHFMKNLAMFGGVLSVAVEELSRTEG